MDGSRANGEYLGIFSATLNISSEALLGTVDIQALSSLSELSNGLLLELSQFRNKHGLPWRRLGVWVQTLCQDYDIKLPSEQALRYSIGQISNHAAKLKKGRKNAKKLDTFLHEQYNFPSSHQPSDMSPRLDTITHSPTPSRYVPHMEQGTLEQASQHLAAELSAAQETTQEQEEKLHKYTMEVDSLKVRHVQQRRKLKRQDHKFDTSKKRIQDLQHTLSLKSEEVDKAKKTVAIAVKARERYRSKGNYYIHQHTKVMEKVMEVADEVQEMGVDNMKQRFALEKIISQLQETISELQAENLQLHDELTAAKDCQLATLKNGKFTDGVRQCCHDLLSRNVGVRNIEPVINSVLSNIVGVELERLPKYTTLVDMLAEMRGLACMQVADELATAKDITLHSDGTTKYGEHYGSFQISTGESSYSLGLLDMSAGTAQNTLDSLKVIFEDINLIAGKGSAERILVAIKNTMSDRHIVQKKINELLEDYRKDILPQIVDDWSKLTSNEQERFCRLNTFFCGMHLLVGMADTASSTLHQWESTIFEEPVGAAAIPSQYKCSQNEAGTVRTIRTACKALQRHGSAKSGVYSRFLDFLKTRGIKTNPLIKFQGNRFNILFYDAGALFSISSLVVEFLTSVWGTPNLLLRALLADMKVPTYRAGCKALGLINKVVTGPLWRLLESETSITAMSGRYQQMVEHFSIWGEDASTVVTGEAILFEDIAIHKDHIWDSLITPYEHDALVQEALQVIFTSMEYLCHHLLEDHLEGQYADPSDSLCEETASVPNTNTISERDFAKLDRLLREKPNATTLSLESMILYSNNKTASWLHSKSSQERAVLITAARSKAREFRKIFHQRRQQMLKQRADYLQHKQLEGERRRRKVYEKKEKLTNSVMSDGLWQTREQVEVGLMSYRSKAAKLKALKYQLDFRCIVLQQVYSDKSVFQAQIKGRKFTIEEMKENLCKLLKQSGVSSAPSLTGHQSVPSSVDLVGKRVRHKWLLDGEEVFYFGTVLGLVPGMSTWYNVKYDGEDDIISLNLHEDLKTGDLVIIDS